jgi:uncharacterized protein
MTISVPFVSSFYAALLTLMALALATWVIRQRGRARVGLGDGGDAQLQRTIRVHANFIEYVPLALIAIALGEMLGVPRWLVHALGIALVIGRLMHAQGVGGSAGASTGRLVGMGLTYLVMIVAAIALLWRSIVAGAL